MGRNTHSVSGACREGITTCVETLTVSGACREGITTRVGTLTLSVGHVGKG